MVDAIDWRLVAGFLDRVDQFSLLALNKAFANSPLRHDFFETTTWRVPVTRDAGERVFRSLTTKDSIRRVVLHASWQQEFLAQLPALESVHFDGL